MEKLASNEQSSSASGDTKKVTLNSGDQLFSELRDKNFNAIGPTLSSKAKAVSAKYDVCVHGFSEDQITYYCYGQFVSNLSEAFFLSMGNERVRKRRKRFYNIETKKNFNF